MHWSHEVGQLAEEKVQAHFENQGYELIRARYRTPFAEIDLLMRTEREYVLIEVKSLSSRGFLETRLGKRQKERLRHARDWVEQRTESNVSLILAMVEETGKILLFNLSEDDLR